MDTAKTSAIINIIIDPHDIPIFQALQIKIVKDLSEKLYLISQSANEIHVVRKDDRNNRIIKVGKKLIRGIIYC